MSIPLNYRNWTYTGVLCANPQKDVIVFASNYFDQILFFNIDGKIIKEHYFSTIKKPLLSTTFSGVSSESPIYFSKIYGTPEHCYALRVNRPITDIKEDKASIPMQLLSFDWDGNLVAVYEYKSYSKVFCVDESTNTLYGVFNNEENEYSPISIDIVKIKLD